jgi:hypothetical protein
MNLKTIGNKLFVLGVAVASLAWISGNSGIGTLQTQPVIITSGSFSWTEPSTKGQVNIDLRVLLQSDGQFRWEYIVKNRSYNPPGGNGFSGFNIVFASPVEELQVERQFGPSDWVMNCCGIRPPQGAEWDKPRGPGVMPGQSATFGFLTQPREFTFVKGTRPFETSWAHTHSERGLFIFTGDLVVPSKKIDLPPSGFSWIVFTHPEVTGLQDIYPILYNPSASGTGPWAYTLRVQVDPGAAAEARAKYGRSEDPELFRLSQRLSTSTELVFIGTVRELLPQGFAFIPSIELNVSEPGLYKIIGELRRGKWTPDDQLDPPNSPVLGVFSSTYEVGGGTDEEEVLQDLTEESVQALLKGIDESIREALKGDETLSEKINNAKIEKVVRMRKGTREIKVIFKKDGKEIKISTIHAVKTKKFLFIPLGKEERLRIGFEGSKLKRELENISGAARVLALALDAINLIQAFSKIADKDLAVSILEKYLEVLKEIDNETFVSDKIGEFAKALSAGLPPASQALAILGTIYYSYGSGMAEDILKANRDGKTQAIRKVLEEAIEKLRSPSVLSTSRSLPRRSPFPWARR